MQQESLSAAPAGKDHMVLSCAYVAQDASNIDVGNLVRPAPLNPEVLVD